MTRLIKRYGSRKLYDTEESRYVSLEEIAQWIREGQEIRVVDNRTSADVTGQTLTQIISEEGRRNQGFLRTDLLHDLIRMGENAVSTGVEQIQTRVDNLLQAGVNRIGPVRRVRDEMTKLQERLAELEQTLGEIERERAARAESAPETTPEEAGEVSAPDAAAPETRSE